jgi:hypothetical protein
MPTRAETFPTSQRASASADSTERAADDARLALLGLLALVLLGRQWRMQPPPPKHLRR